MDLLLRLNLVVIFPYKTLHLINFEKKLNEKNAFIYTVSFRVTI